MKKKKRIRRSLRCSFLFRFQSCKWAGTLTFMTIFALNRYKVAETTAICCKFDRISCNTKWDSDSFGHVNVFALIPSPRIVKLYFKKNLNFHLNGCREAVNGKSNLYQTSFFFSSLIHFSVTSEYLVILYSLVLLDGMLLLKKQRCSLYMLFNFDIHNI